MKYNKFNVQLFYCKLGVKPMIFYRLYSMYRRAGWTRIAAMKRAWSVA